MGRSRNGSATCASLLPPSVKYFTAIRRVRQRKTGGCGSRRRSPPVEGCKCRRRPWSRQQGTGCWHGYRRPASSSAAADLLWRPFFGSCSHVRGISSRPPGSLLPAPLVSSLAAPRPTPLLSILGDCLTYALSRHAMHPIALTSAMRNAPYRSHVSHAQCTLSQCALSSIVTPRLPHVVTCHCAIPHA